MKRFRLDSRVILLAALAVGLLLMAAPAIAQQPVSDDEVNAIAKELYCPVCESTPLDVCPTQACADWREVIRTKLAEGQTEEEIRAYFEEQYGARALAEPPRQGFTLAVWLLPIAAVLAGAFFFSRYVRRISAAGAPDVAFEESLPDDVAPPKPPARDDYESRIEQELQELEK